MNRKEKLKNSKKNVGTTSSRPCYEGILKLKEQKGITIIALIITIVVILILASFGTYVAMDTVRHSRLVKFVSYMQVIQRKVDELVADNNTTTLGTLVAETGKQSEIGNILLAAKENGEIQSVDTNHYRYFNKQALSTQLDLDNIEDEIVINFATREVVSLSGIQYESKMYYTQYLLPTGQQIITQAPAETRSLSFNIAKDIDGLQATITISNINITNGTLSYREENGSWNVITNYTEQSKNEVATISKSGTYTFKLTDNTNELNTYEQNITLVLANPPVLEEGMTYVKEDYDYSGGINATSRAVAKVGTTQYVWVPRFAYQTESKEKLFVRELSYISTYNQRLGEDWIVPNEFGEKTGIWMLEEELEEGIEELTRITITYDKNCTEEVTNLPSKVTVEKGVAINLSTLIPERKNYRFEGWNTKQDGKGNMYSSGATITLEKDITLYAMWQEEEKRTITIWYTQSGSVLNGIYPDDNSVHYWPSSTKILDQNMNTLASKSLTQKECNCTSQCEYGYHYGEITIEIDSTVQKIIIEDYYMSDTNSSARRKYYYTIDGGSRLQATDTNYQKRTKYYGSDSSWVNRHFFEHTAEISL